MSERAQAPEGAEAERSSVQEMTFRALVVFDIITVDEIKEFCVILGPLVALVSAATGFYYGTKGS